MPRRRSRAPFHEPSLVPLADMLTNTVGIMVFILIFTVLTAGGAVIAKRLPMEHTSSKRDITVICANDRVYILPDALVDRFLNPLGKPELSRSGFAAFVEKFKGQVVENDNLKLTGEGELIEDPFTTRLDLTVVCNPKAAGGLTAGDLKSPDGPLAAMLRESDPEKQFVMFLVLPDSIEAFRAARDVAAGMNFATGWSPQRPNEPIRLSLTGGRKPKPH